MWISALKNPRNKELGLEAGLQRQSWGRAQGWESNPPTPTPYASQLQINLLGTAGVSPLEEARERANWG